MSTDPIAALRSLGGVARHKDLRLRGVSDRSLAAAVASGVVHRFGRGTYAVPGADMADVMATVWRGSIGCVSALERSGVALLRKPPMPHIVVPRERSLSRPRSFRIQTAVVHRLGESACDPSEVPTALGHASRCLAPAAHLVAVESAFRKGYIDVPHLRRLGAAPQRRRDWLLREFDHRAESPLETVGRLALLAAGLEVRAQVQVTREDRVDLVVEESVVVELDGWEYHSDRVQIARDHERDRRLLEAGLPVARFTYGQVVRHPLLFAQQVCALAGKQPDPRLFQHLQALGLLR